MIGIVFTIIFSIRRGIHHLFFNMNNICPIVISGPSGGGKSTILTRAMKEYPDMFGFSVSNTTRQPREGEQNGVHYWFTSKYEMEEMIKNNEFIEYATFGSNIYGTSKKAVETVIKTGKICILDLELQGVRSIKNANFKAKFILIKAPTIEELEKRLRARNTETEESLQLRLKHAKEDMEVVDNEPHLFDHIIVNDDFENAYNKFMECIKDEIKQLQSRHTA
ncbi:Guanylate kinase-like domain and Guanylate kinase/L-type calcium channel beta subunit domain and Guanylate kinase family and P-loop containing nucleoside triphosphate hydrolase domain-containing protein [Strongyloides ratti]|uniref:guanylate kinase n=1 Tax=Strongyloides ratti TaxID=34506 RepID=A0A090LIR6_STRRB|nr:Guanylate kinase-like domain and Guanylate kinase/L-type calcium channel beta subunit domain and Guanylate kinase family and P-loop containing nucleoside triphosphate hydrolase domain-containing protein [Strongyloides ratti]CEF67395.1 Guanylate kinase-like domain and Guanylate kinase/L-type calcium channel beta subunit domain and Guanylate kinase family and P-loop containing nucleoside triphosphate hydrolase domain-containing protein [Strongyloides ratti]